MNLTGGLCGTAWGKGSVDESFTNILTINSIRAGKVPELVIEFILTSQNIQQIDEMIKQAVRLQAEKVTFKQCNVVHQPSGKRYGFLPTKETRDEERLRKSMTKARRIAKKLKIGFTAFSHLPDEQPVCDHDPRYSLFIRHDGIVAPCVNLAFRNSVFFLNKKINMPLVHYEQLPTQDLLDVWKTEACRNYRKSFHARVSAYDTAL
jgi:MoaA/NifB/PqqE/SkfB family radical SAM enzyme